MHERCYRNGVERLVEQYSQKDSQAGEEHVVEMSHLCHDSAGHGYPIHQGVKPKAHQDSYPTRRPSPCMIAVRFVMAVVVFVTMGASSWMAVV